MNLQARAQRAIRGQAGGVAINWWVPASTAVKLIDALLTVKKKLQSTSVFVKYLSVGCIAYALYAIGIYIIICFSISATTSSVMIAIVYAVITLLTYLGHRLITFSDKQTAGVTGSLVKYLSLSFVGALIAGQASALLSMLSNQIRLVGQLMVALVWNVFAYLASSNLIF